MKTATHPTPTRPILVGLDAIGAAFQRSRWTIRRWIEQHAFPAAQLPDGTWVTTHSLIDRWLLVRAFALGADLSGDIEKFAYLVGLR